MQQRATRLILAGVSTLAVGIGVAGTVSALDSSGHHGGFSLTHAKAAAATAELNNAESTAKGSKTTVPHLDAAPAKPAAPAAPARPAAPAKAAAPAAPPTLLTGHTLGSYFWDTGDSGNGDTGAPASGLPMQEGCFASPSWPMGTRGYVIYKGKKAPFFICDRGPGDPSSDGVMLDIDGVTYAKLTGGKWIKPDVVGGNGQAGRIPVTYFVTHWGAGPGAGAPHAYGS
jgi:hypothetical protein